MLQIIVGNLLATGWPLMPIYVARSQSRKKRDIVAMVKFAPILRYIPPRPAKKRYTNHSRTWGLTPFDDLGRCDGLNPTEQRIYDVNQFLRRVLAEADNTKDVDEREFTTARDFILNTPARPEIEWRYEQIFADILGLRSARCQSSDCGPLIKMNIKFNRAERPGITLGYMHLILRDLPKEFGRRMVTKSVLMRSIGDKATLTFTLEPNH